MSGSNSERKLLDRRIFIDSSSWPVADPRGQEWHVMRIPGIYMLGRYDHQSASFPLPDHSHPNRFEVSLLVKGRQTYRVGEKIYHLKGGEQFVTLPDEVHDTADHVEEKGTMYWLIFDAEPVHGDWLNLKPADAREVIHKFQTIPSRHFVAHPESHLILERVFHLLLSPASRLNQLQAETLLLHYLFLTIEAAATSALPDISPQVQAALEAIAKCGDREWINLGALARHSGWSEAHFKTRFRREMGMPPAEYMVRRKIDLAKHRLTSHKARVTGIARDLGFSSSQYFATVFKRYVRQTPSQFVAGISAKQSS